MALRDLFADTRPLRVPTFKRMFYANIVTTIGAQMSIVVVPAQIYAITQDSGYVGLAGIFGLVPLVLFGLYGGSLSDSMDRRKLLLVSSTGLTIASFLLFLWALIGTHNVWLILFTLAFQQAFFAVNQPARTAILPSLLPTEVLAAATTLNMTVGQFGAIVGPLAGGMLIPLIGFPLLYLIDTIGILVSMWAVWRLPALPPGGHGLPGSAVADASAPEAAVPTPEPPARPRAGFRSVWEGLVYLSRSPILMMSFLVDIIAMLFGMPRALFPQIAHESFGGPTDGGFVFALLSAGIAIGSVLGGLFSGWVSKVQRHGLAVLVAIIIWGAAMALFGAVLPLAGSFWWLALLGAMLFLMVGGGADVISASFRNTILLEAADDRVRGRLQGVFTVVVAGGPRLADVLHGYAANTVGTAWASAGGGILVVLGIVIAAVLVPSFARYRSGGARSNL
ncbi:MFS transporter [Brevibacterium sp. 50QC2O2]|uniref:MFS transporter n=1 Tax=Brevibacterium TaxID=1696 RepID=UPI00211C64EB|nr:MULTISPECIES: MFS transporter [unclassified Brevibacterium]MCQ9369128.1 MFS transporter [Brevibacterium sp. 91QC2O2]MCQ9386485.1 MFS transporter [Brevibacterium sp. 68QC2CO]MCQ9387051.1 MFS transporter [Brevibacterium sp. 50QC2O2]